MAEAGNNELIITYIVHFWCFPCFHYYITIIHFTIIAHYYMLLTRQLAYAYAIFIW